MTRTYQVPGRKPVAAVVLAAGKGTRMKSSLPKVLHSVAGLPILGHILRTLEKIGVAKIIVVHGAEQADIAEFARANGAEVALQNPPQGTGDAARCALPALSGHDGDVVVLYGDNPLLTALTFETLFETRAQSAAIGLMGFHVAEPGSYGRLIQLGNGDLDRIVEARDATLEELKVTYCNAGGFLLDAGLLRSLLGELKNENAQHEYYLTDIITGARSRGLRCLAAKVSAEDVLGINSRTDLAQVEGIMQRRLRERALANGATMIAPETVWLSFDTEIGNDVTIGPNVFFGRGVKIASNVTINGFCHFEGCTVAEGAIIGPFARLRPGTVLERDVHIGNFVEVKKSVVEQGAKANHLAYIGDARVGARSNIGAGTITCNYDGFDKHHTDIGADVFVGSNSSLVAPLKIGAGATIGAGSVISKDVPPSSLAVERSEQRQISGWSDRFRSKKRTEKAARVKSKE